MQKLAPGDIPLLNVYDAGPALTQHCIWSHPSFKCLRRWPSFVSGAIPLLHVYDAGPALTRHWIRSHTSIACFIPASLSDTHAMSRLLNV